MKFYLDCKRVDTAINRAKNILLGRVNKNGIYENFGVEEVRLIREKFVDISDYSNDMNLIRTKINNFERWCNSYAPMYRFKEDYLNNK